MSPDIKEFAVNFPDMEPHKVSYAQWGAGNGKLLVCIHGLTMNGRSFDWLAAALANDYHIICPDMPGRGRSGWLGNYQLYNNGYYVEVVKALIASLGFKQVDWVGTSMGGLMGMIAASTTPALIGKMVLNDIGPFISADGMRRIATYIKDEIKFSDLSMAQKRYREVYEPFKMTDEQFAHMYEFGLRSTEHGAWSFNHDPNLGKPFKDENNNPIVMQEFDLWRIWEAIKCPVLVLRGEVSDILSREVAAQMAARPNTQLVEFAGYGHVPPLMNEEQIGVVRKFLVDR